MARQQRRNLDKFCMNPRHVHNVLILINPMFPQKSNQFYFTKNSWKFGLYRWRWKLRQHFMERAIRHLKHHESTVKPVCNDHLCYKMHYLWLVQ